MFSLSIGPINFFYTKYKNLIFQEYWPVKESIKLRRKEFYMSLLLLLRNGSIKYQAGRAVQYLDKLKIPDNTFLEYIYILLCSQ